jgi:hypothetical protein
MNELATRLVLCSLTGGLLWDSHDGTVALLVAS